MAVGFLTRSRMEGRDERLYQVYVPADYTPTKAWPAILFLHGAGEGGKDGLLPTEYQLGSALRRNAAAFPGLVVFPQVATRKPNWDSDDVEYALRVFDDVERDFSVDPTRRYLTGVSSGATAAWHALDLQPERFAAGLIVAGTPQPGGPAVHAALAAKLQTVPMWMFHGDDDPLYPVSLARALAADFQAVGARLRYTELAGFGHDVWDIAYYSPDVAAWLFDQRKVPA